MGYHQRQIKKGEIGWFSKVKEEFEELEDAWEQGADIMFLCEAADLIGSLESYIERRYGIKLDQILRMKDLTRSAFEDGSRK